MTVLPQFLSWLTTLFHPQHIIDNLIFICFGLCDSSSVSHFPLILFFIWAVPTFLLHTTSLQTKVSLFLCFFYLISYQFPLLPECSLLLFLLPHDYLPHLFTLSPFLPLALSLSPYHKKSLTSLPYSQQAPWLPPLLLHLTFDYSSTGATNAVTWQHQRASHCSSTFSDLAIFSVLPKCSFLNHLPAHRWVKPPEKLNVKQKPSLNIGRILTFPLSPKERLNYKRFKKMKGTHKRYIIDTKSPSHHAITTFLDHRLSTGKWVGERKEDACTGKIMQFFKPHFWK